MEHNIDILPKWAQRQIDKMEQDIEETRDKWKQKCEDLLEARDIVSRREGKQAGIKEVVEWLRQDEDFEILLMSVYGMREWQAQLKDWGLPEKEERCQ